MSNKSSWTLVLALLAFSAGYALGRLDALQPGSTRDLAQKAWERVREPRCPAGFHCIPNEPTSNQ
jgi:hypothetical protein